LGTKGIEGGWGGGGCLRDLTTKTLFEKKLTTLSAKPDLATKFDDHYKCFCDNRRVKCDDLRVFSDEF